MTNRITLLSDTQAIVSFDRPVSDETLHQVATVVDEALKAGKPIILAEPFELDDRRPIAVLDDLRRLEAKIDRLTEFSGWRTADGIPLTVAEQAEIDRLNGELE